MTWCIEFCPKNQLGFLSKFRWSPKKKKKERSSIYFYCSIYFLLFCWFSKKEKGRERGVWMGMLNILGGGKIAQKIWNRPKFWHKIAQKIWNCPKFWHTIDTLKPSGGSAPPHLLRHWLWSGRSKDQISCRLNRTVLPTAPHRSKISSEGAVLPANAITRRCALLTRYMLRCNTAKLWKIWFWFESFKMLSKNQTNKQLVLRFTSDFTLEDCIANLKTLWRLKIVRVVLFARKQNFAEGKFKASSRWAIL